MKRYLIKEILLADTYERIALVKRLSDDKEIFVYFLSHDDFVTDIKEIKRLYSYEKVNLLGLKQSFLNIRNKDFYYAIGDGNHLFGKVTDELKKNSWRKRVKIYRNSRK